MYDSTELDEILTDMWGQVIDNALGTDLSEVLDAMGGSVGDAVREILEDPDAVEFFAEGADVGIPDDVLMDAMERGVYDMDILFSEIQEDGNGHNIADSPLYQTWLLDRITDGTLHPNDLEDAEWDAIAGDYSDDARDETAG